MTTFWERTKKLIKAAGMNQEQFAKYIDIPIGTFQGWIHHDRIPEALTACDIAAALGVSVEYLAYGRDRDNTRIRERELAQIRTWLMGIHAPRCKSFVNFPVHSGCHYSCYETGYFQQRSFIN